MTTVEDLKRWEQEEQTWELLSLMLQVQHPIPESERAKVGADLLRPNKTNQIHRYSSEKDVWDSFLASDDEAWERNTVVQWLQTCANRSGQDIEQVVEELESGADRGSGLWAHSWLFTKEAIKGQKRLRSWPKALEPNDPGLDASLLNSEKTKALVTQLDPDAITRQNRALEKQDLYFERAMWLACWEMVRRGKGWDYVRDWCQERVEGWRATAMRGDPRSLRSNDSSATSWQSRALWRQTCALAAKDGGIDEYEKAVYGVLSGYLPSVLKVSRCWDDYLFAQYNSDLLHSFDDHVQISFADRGSTALMKKQSSFKFSAFGGQSVQPGDKIVEKMKQFEATKEEARSPFKMLQSSLIGKSFTDFLYTHGVRLAETINAKGRSQIIPPMNVRIPEDYVTAPISMDDHDYLRIITHIIFIFQDLGFDFGDKSRRQAMENIVVAYVDYLSKAGKQQLLPLYASRLSTARSWYCLGRQLPSIQEHGERETLMQLMKQYDVNVYGVLSSQMQSVIRDAVPKKDSSIRYLNLRILEDNRIDAMGLRPIKANFIGKVMADDQRDLVHGFEWYLLLEGHWEETMTAGVAVYKFLIRESQHILHSLIPETNITISKGSHGLAAARMLSQTVTFTDISLAKTGSILGRSLDLSKSEDVTNNEAESGRTTRNTRSHLSSSQRRRRSSSVRRVRSERELLLDDGDTFRAFENLFAALNALEEWKDVADEGQK
jgi:nuclear pore complex protein Nup107